MWQNNVITKHKIWIRYSIT